MWFVSLDRHHKFAWYRQWTFESRFWIVAYAVYQAWKFVYLVSSMYAKQVSLYRAEGEVLYLRGARKLCNEPAIIRRLQWARKNSTSRRYWDYS